MNQESVNNLSRLYYHANTLFKIDKSYEEIIKTPEERIDFLRSIIKNLKELKEGKEKDKLIDYLETNIEMINENPNEGLSLSPEYIKYYDYKEKAPSKEEIEIFFKLLEVNLKSFKEKSNFNFEIPLSEIYDGVSEKLSIKSHNIVHMLGLTKTNKDSIQESILEEIKQENNINEILTPEEGIKLIIDNFEEYKNKYIAFTEKVKKWEEEYKNQRKVNIDENDYIIRDNTYKKAYEKQFGKKYIYFNQNIAKLISYFNFLNFNNLNEIIVDFEDIEMHNKRNHSRKLDKTKPDVFLASYNIEKYEETYIKSLAGEEDASIVSLIGFKTNGYEVAQTTPDNDEILLEGEANTQMQTSVMTLNDDFYRFSHYFIIDLIKEDGKPVYMSNPKQKIIFNISHGREEEAQKLKNSLNKLNNEWMDYLKDSIKNEPNHKIKLVIKLKNNGDQVTTPANVENLRLAALRKYMEKIKKFEIELNHKKYNYIKKKDKIENHIDEEETNSNHKHR